MPDSNTIPRIKEHLPLIQGKGQYVDDIHLSNTVHIAFVRSPYAHAQIVDIDIDEALTMPGVLAIFTGKVLCPHLKPLDPPMQIPIYQPTQWYPLATEKVIYVGEPVAVVVAIDRYHAEDAAEMVFVDYEVLPVVATAQAAMADDAPLIHAGMKNNILASSTAGEGAGKSDFDEADIHLHGTFQHPRVHCLPMETRGVLADYRPETAELILWSSTQVPHILRDAVGHALDYPVHQLRVIAPNVGGGFGLKSNVYPEEILVPYLAKRLGRPVKWTQDRMEALQAGSHARDIVVEATLAANNDGKIVGLKATAICDVGAYNSYPFTACLDVFSIGYALPGPYDLQYYAFEGFAVATTKCVVSAYRGVGTVLGPLVMDGLLNRLACKLDMDPLEVRKRNLVPANKFPYLSPSGSVYDSGDYPALLDLAIEESGYPELRQQQAVARAEGRLLGVGLTCFIESSATGRSVFVGRRMDAVPGFDAAILRVNRQGDLEAFISTPSQGQGQFTTFAQLLAQEMGISDEKIRIRLGDTATTPYGSGTFASRSLVSGGGAMLKAATKLKQKLIELAAVVWDIEPSQVRYADGAAFAIERPNEQRLTFAELSAIAHAPFHELPRGFEPGLEVHCAYDPPPATTSNGVHIALVEIDRHTGQVTIPKYIVGEDCGRVLNRHVVDGQVRGGIMQGIGIALFEELHFDTEGQLLSGSLMDYLVPSAYESPIVDIVHMETPSPDTEGGFKGVAESGIIGAPATIANAILDALQVSPENVQLPLTPERVLTLIQKAAL